MKRVLFIIVSSVVVLLVGAILLIPFNDWYWNYKGYSGGYDDEMRMFDFLLFVEWPILLVSGGLIGNYIYKKRLTKSSSGR